MKFSFIKLALWIFICVTIFSCTKEQSVDSSAGGNGGSTGAGAIAGTWNFAGLSANTKSDVSETDSTDIIRAVTTADYSTTNNKGTVTFGTNTFTGTGIGYDLSTTAFVKFYTNGVLEDSLQMPFSFTLPPATSSGTYKLVGKDSLYFTGGFISIGLDSMETKPIGYKYVIAGNKLTLTSKFTNSFQEVDNGVMATIKQSADITVVLQK
ncbi:MAG: hypothetical protein EKK37_11360 [Sphingobacteriales bacterium]|nr:MAG: hypothetical protein EKK37_11360 [Sphingobacteriales bacterium]